MHLSRLGLRDTFLRLDRRPRLVFYTTSSDKFAQAQFAFQRSGLSITEFKSRDDPYREDEDGTSIELLTRAIDEIRLTVGQADGTLFFVEDTSLRIKALSTDAHEVPGLHVKEWFKDTSFSALDAELQQRENDRTATVKSDIALHVPHLATRCFSTVSRGESYHLPSLISRRTSSTPGFGRTASMDGLCLTARSVRSVRWALRNLGATTFAQWHLCS